MKQMSTLETWVVNSPFRAPLARGEVRQFRRMGRIPEGARVLEIGCGAGITTRAIIDAVRPSHMSAFDFDEVQVERARYRLDAAAIPVDLRQGDATQLPYADESFDCVFVIGVLHHIPRWRQVLLEISRVLAPGGTLCFAEFTKTRLTSPLFRLFPHPAEAMFERRDLFAGLDAAGIKLIDVKATAIYSLFGVAMNSAAPQHVVKEV